MIKKAVKEELCQISLTGIRSLILLNLLTQKPMSLDDIRREFIGYNIMTGKNSDDILRIDINTLRTMGCEISRADHRTNNKYVLLDHPFKINLNADEVGVIRRAFNEIKKSCDINVLMSYDELFKKIANHVANKEAKELLLGISPLKQYQSDIVLNLKAACENKAVVKLLYKSPASKSESEKEIYADKVALKNDKLYFYGVDKNSDEPIYLNIKRILKILSQENCDEEHTVKPITIKFILKQFGVSGLEEGEKIISGNLTEGYLISGNYHNAFYATQRILSFGSKCTIIEPDDFKEKMIEILIRMRDVYND